MIHIVTWTPTPGWGAQIGELSIALKELPRGLVVNRINVFRTPDGAICFGPPLTPIGEHAGRHAGFDFPDPADRQRFYDALFAALTAAHPELLKKEG
jgi:hypothetical protein